MSIYEELLNEADKVINTKPITISKEYIRENTLSTGFLILDLLTGGGIPAGKWLTSFGEEQSAKSTTAYSMLYSAYKNNVPVLEIWDYEGSFDQEYAENIFGGVSLDEVFGVLDSKGKWKIPPKIRYYAPSIGEDFFNHLHKLLKLAPDVIKIEDEWFDVYPNDKKSKALIDKLGLEIDNKKSNKDKLYVKSELEGNLRGLIVVDSYVAMLPQEMDEDEVNKQQAQQASFFSKHIKRIKPYLTSKRFTIVGINQLRKAPMAFGNPLYEPAGEALKFFSDLRIQHTPVSIPHASGRIEAETSVLADGDDEYGYVKLSIKKNKLASTAGKTAYMRVWVRNPALENDKGSGLCPVWDTFEYLKLTGQFEGNRNKINISIEIKGKEVFKTTKPLKWLDFKKIVLYEVIDKKKELKELYKKLGIKSKKPLRQLLFKQIKNKEAFKLLD